jgi:N-acetyl sugar amidotransferase
MDTTDPEIVFDQQGNCNHCNEFITKRSKQIYQGKKSDFELDCIVSEMKRAGKGKEYDCIIGLSGGIDSCYAAYIAKQKGLRVLAVHLDNGWNSEEAVLNIKNVAQKLGIDYESYVLDWEEFKDLQLAFLKASIPEAETPTDIAIPAAWNYFANKYKVKYIISGGNFATEGILPKCWHYNAKDLTYLNHIQKTFGTVPLKKFPTFGFLKEMYFKLVKGVKMNYLLNYVPFEKDKAMAFLKKELDWKYYGGKHYESKYTGFIHSYYLYEKFGIDYRRATLATQVCSGEVTRTDALRELSIKPYKLEQVNEQKQYISKKLGISLGEFDEIIKLPPKWYRSYPNDERRLKFIYDTYRKLFKKEKLANF